MNRRWQAAGDVFWCAVVVILPAWLVVCWWNQ